MMSKQSFLVALFCFVCSFSFAQNRPTYSNVTFSLGVHGGVTGVSLTDIDDIESQSKTGGMVGGFFRVGNRFYLESGLDYYKNRTTFEVPLRGIETELKFSSLNFPILLGFKIANENNFNIRLFAGGSIHHIRDLEDNDFFEKDDLQPTYGMVNVGIGIDIWRFVFDFKYEQSFDDFFEHQSVNVDSHLTRLTGSIGFLIIK